MITQDHLEMLLTKYYQGESTPQDEIELYLALLEQPPHSPYQVDRIAMERMMWGANRLKQAQRHWVLLFVSKKWWRVASVAIFVSVTLSIVLWQKNDIEPIEYSYRNQTPIQQTEVDAEAFRVFELLNNCFSQGNQYSERTYLTFQEASDHLTHSYQQLLPFDEVYPEKDPFSLPLPTSFNNSFYTEFR